MVDRDNATILEDYYYLGSAFVYRFNGRFNEELDWVVIWFNPATKIGEPRQELKIYTELRDPTDFTDEVWKGIFTRLKRADSTHSDEIKGCYAMAEISVDDTSTTPITVVATIII